MIKLYGRGDVIDTAFIVHNGPIYVGIGTWKPSRIECVSIVVGTLAHFTQDEALKKRGRLFDVYVDNLEEVQRVSFDRVDDLVRDYDFGFYTNKFLAQLVNLTNQFYFEQTKEISAEFRRYQAHAQLFAHLVDDIQPIAVSLKHDGLKKIVENCRKQQLYTDGVILNKVDLINAIAVPPKHMSEFVKRFKKNTLICKERSIANSMYVLLRGRVGVTVNGKYVASIDKSGESFGELAMFSGGRRTASLVAEEDTDVYEVKQDEMKIFHQGHRNVFNNIALISAKRVTANIDRIEYHHKLAKLFVKIDGGKDLGGELLENGQKMIQGLFSNLVQVGKDIKDPALGRLLKKHGIE